MQPSKIFGKICGNMDFKLSPISFPCMGYIKFDIDYESSLQHRIYDSHVYMLLLIFETTRIKFTFESLNT